MQSTTLFLVIAFLGTAAFFFGRSRSLAMVGGRSQLKTLHSLPGYYGYFTAIWCLLPALAVVLLWVLLEPRVILAMLVNSLPEAMQAMSQGELNLLLNNIQNLASGDAISGESNPMLESAAAKYVELQADSQRLLATLTLGLAGVGGVIAWRRITPDMRARNAVEKVVMVALICASSIAIFTTVGIVLSVLFEAIRFFREVPITEFLFGLNWSPQMAIRADQVGSSGSFGAAR